MLLGFTSFEDFARWYAELGKLKIFWAKIIKDIHLLSTENEVFFISVEWLVRKKIKKAVLAVAEKQCKVSSIIESLRRYESSTKVLIAPEDLSIDLNLVNARSILYFWEPNASILEPNRNIRIEVYRDWSNDEIEVFRSIHRQSWGFFIPPRLHDHIVVLGFLNDIPVAMAYLNTHNFNIDYGIHVIRTYWRRRIGTRLLAELLELANVFGASSISVVRVFRNIRGTSSDIRAVNFYRANNPSIRMSIYRLKS